ncbi:MAG: CvpA family protein [Dysgonamonadaceae bacterium]|nr:CvpA family protein [Dysgonamonadaceae bacterium]
MNWLDLAIIIFVAIGLIKGLFDGFVKQVISLVSFVFAIFFAGKIARPMRDFLSHDSVTNIISPHIITAVCYILAFILIIVLFSWLGKLLNKAMLGPISFINHVLGGVVGCIFTLLFLSLLFNLLTVFDSDSRVLKEQVKNESVLFYKVELMVPLISPFIKEAQKLNEYLPEPLKENLQENKEPDKNNTTEDNLSHI